MSVVPKSSTRKRLIVGALIAGVVVLFTAANAHLVYVSVTSQPDCVDHLKDSGGGSGRFRAAQSAC